MIGRLENSVAQCGQLVAFWNRCHLHPFVIDERLMQQYLLAPGSSVWVYGRPWEGVLWARHGEIGVTLDAILVLPQRRRRGVGRALVERFAASLPPSTAWRFGGGSHHFVPGLPEALSEHHGFFTALGWQADWEAHDLLWQAPSPYGATTWDETRYGLLDASQGEQLAGLLSHFGPRWQRDTEARRQHLEGGRPEEMMGAFHEGALVGFCHIWSPRSYSLGPSTFWLERDAKTWGGIGPLGVHPDHRGFGFGAGVVESAMAYLRSRGAQQIGVDWTGLPDFYERCGFRRWLSYRGYHRPCDL